MENLRKSDARARSAWGIGVAASALLLALPATSWAWAAKAYYPSALEPTLPDAQEAQRYHMQAPTIFRTLSHAHRQSLAHSWKSITPPVTGQADTD